jgi:hypothetical protein
MSRLARSRLARAREIKDRPRRRVKPTPAGSERPHPWTRGRGDVRAVTFGMRASQPFARRKQFRHDKAARAHNKRSFYMSSDTTVPGLIKTFFWMVHYDFRQDEQTNAGMKPVRAGKQRVVTVVHRNVYGRHTIAFNMPRETEKTPDASTYRGTANLRNRIIGFYATQDEANGHMNARIWSELQKDGAVYAELHSMKLDVAVAKENALKLVA